MAEVSSEGGVSVREKVKYVGLAQGICDERRTEVLSEL